MYLIEEREPFVSEFLDLFEGEGLAAFHSAAINCLASHLTALPGILHDSHVVLVLFTDLTLLLCRCVLEESEVHCV